MCDNAAIVPHAARASHGSDNTALGLQADVSSSGLTNATALGANAIGNASNKVRIGYANVTVIEGQVAFTASSDRTKKVHPQPVDGEAVQALEQRTTALQAAEAEIAALRAQQAPLLARMAQFEALLQTLLATGAAPGAAPR